MIFRDVGVEDEDLIRILVISLGSSGALIPTSDEEFSYVSHNACEIIPAALSLAGRWSPRQGSSSAGEVRSSAACSLAD